MSKEKKVAAPVENDVAAAAVPVMVPERLSEVDKLGLSLAKTKCQTALAEAKTALATSENAELTYRYFILQLYMKYGLTAEDALSEAGDIVRGGAVQKPQQ